jgi:hypothetical protein
MAGVYRRIIALGYEDKYGKERRMAQYAVYVLSHPFPTTKILQIVN